MNHERVELVERHPLAVPIAERPGLVVGVEDPRPEPAEEAHHRQIDLPVTAVNGRVDEAGATAIVAKQVAPPEVPVQARRRLGRAAQLVEPPEQPLEALPHPGRRTPLVGGPAQLRLQPARAIEVRPALGRRIRLRKPADEVVVIETESLSAMAMQRGQPTSQLLVEVARRRAGRHQFQNQELVGAFGRGHSEHLGNPQGACLAEPAEAARLGGEHPARRAVVGLDEQAAAVGQRDLVGAVDVPSGNGARRGDPTAQRRGQRRFQLRVHGRSGPRYVRDAPASRVSWSSSPRQARSQMSNTSSKPPGPP